MKIPAASSPSRTNTLLAIAWPILAALCTAALWAVTILRADSDAERSRLLLLKEADTYAQAYEQYVTRSIAQMDQITMQLKHSWEHGQRQTLLEDMRADGMFTDHAFVSVGIVGADGKVRSSTRRNGLPDKLLDAAYFVQHKNSNSSALRVDIAPAGFDATREVVLFTRRLDRADEEFDGIVVMAVDAAYFTSFVGQSTLGADGLLAMADTDGRFWIEQSGPETGRPGGPRILGKRSVAAREGGPQLVAGDGFGDGLARAMGWRDSAVYPVVAMVALSQRDGSAAAQAYWEEGRDRAVAGSIALALMAGLASLLSLRAANRAREHEAVRLAYRTATESANDGFYMAAPVRDRKGQIVDFRIVDCNERGASFYGMTRGDLVGRAVSTMDRGVSGDEIVATYRMAMSTGFYEEDRRMAADARLAFAWGRRRLVRVGDGLAVTLQDISERKKYETEMERLANQDSLTGLRNRSWLLNHVPTLLDAAAREGGLALLFVDLDEFKQVNDTHGHAVGDGLLTAAARRLSALLRPGDEVVRFGGDEFVVLMRPARDDFQVAAVADRIVAAFARPFALGEDLQASVGASIGIAVYPRDAQDVDTLIRHADIAMYAAKHEGKGQHRFYDEKLSGGIQKRARLKQELVEAIAAGQFVLHYQPRVDPVSSRLLSMEALLRWRHPEQGMVAPGEFIPFAEASGLIVPIGDIVIEAACAQLAAWRRQGARLVPVSINVSACQFEHGGIAGRIEAALERHGVPATLLEVEITESAMMDHREEILAELAALRALGVKLHIDDFGTGYSSLSQLRTLRMDVLKVDRAFTAELDGGGDGRVFFEAIVSMAHALGMAVVAEGVETAAQLQVLRELGCNEVQGYFISRPLSPEDLARRYLALPAMACA